MIAEFFEWLFHSHQWEYSSFNKCYLEGNRHKGWFPAWNNRRKCLTCGKRQVARNTYAKDTWRNCEYHDWYWMTVQSEWQWQAPSPTVKKIIEPPND